MIVVSLLLYVASGANNHRKEAVQFSVRWRWGVYKVDPSTHEFLHKMAQSSLFPSDKEIIHQ